MKSLSLSCMLSVILTCTLVQQTLANAANVPIIFWASEPTWPGETLLLHGAYFDNGCSLNATPSPARGELSILLSPIPGHEATGSLKFSLPRSLPSRALSLVLTCGGHVAAPRLLNAVVPWWFQGDIGNAASLGGWIVVAGPIIAATPPLSDEAAAIARVRAARDVLTSPLSAGDPVWEDASPLAAAAVELIAARVALAAARATPTVWLRLVSDTTGIASYLSSPSDIANTNFANFSIPSSFTLGSYTLSIANGGGEDNDSNAPKGSGFFTPISFFESTVRSSVTSIPILSPRVWPAGVFIVDETSDPCSPAPCPSSDASLSRALAQATSAGGGTVYFPRGAYFLRLPVVVPPNTIISGAGMDQSAIWFEEWNMTTAPKAPLFSLDDAAMVIHSAPAAMGSSLNGSGHASWGLSDLTIYLTAFHNEVIVISNHSDGFILTRTRIRANPYVFTWGTGPALASRGRIANFTTAQVGQMIDIHGINNRITHNDLFGVNVILNSLYPTGPPMWPQYRRGHAYSIISDNIIWNGQSSHFMQLWRQVLIVRNVFTSATTNSGGQSVGTGPMGGVAQHILHADNTVRMTWGGDREVMTYDDAGGAYYGPLTAVNNSTITIAGDAWPASDWEMGGWGGGQMIVINGTGAGQNVRIAIAGVNVTPTPMNRTWILTAPFTATPDVGVGGSWVQILPFRGRNIFFRDTNIETGPHQYYGHGVESLVNDVDFHSVRGLMAWGQWRGWKPPPPANETNAWEGEGIEREAYKGLMGNGIQPNLHNSYRNVRFTERHHLTNYACGEAGYTEQWGWKSIVAYPANALNANITDSPHALNVGLTYRGAKIQGGFWIGNSTSDVIVEGSDIEFGGTSCIITGMADERFYAADNACTP